MNEFATPKLIKQVIIKVIFSLLFICLLLFVPAGTLNYWNGWLFIGALFIPMFFVMLYLLHHDPDLLRKRMNTKEKEGFGSTANTAAIAPDVLTAPVTMVRKWLTLHSTQ